MASHDSKESRDCLSNALIAGSWGALKASIVSGGLFYATWTYSPFFRHNFSASARTALAIMPVFYTGWLAVELSMHECMQKNLPVVPLDDEDD